MKIQRDGKQVWELEKWMEDVIKHDIDADEFEADMERRLKWTLEHKFEQCYKRLEAEWLPKLQEDPQVANIPANKKAFVEMIFSRPDYEDRKKRKAKESRDVA
jgi:hypothetical protein